MAKVKRRKDIIRDPEEIVSISSKLIDYARENLEKLKILGIIALILLVVSGGVGLYLRYENRKGLELYNKGYVRFSKFIRSGDKKELSKSEKILERIMDEYSHSKAVLPATCQLAYIKFREKRWDDAIGLYKRFLKEIGNDSPYTPFARLCISACYEQKGEYLKAEEILNDLKGKTTGYLKQQVMLSLARIYRLTGRAKESKEISQEFVKLFPDSPFLYIAKEYLRS